MFECIYPMNSMQPIDRSNRSVTFSLCMQREVTAKLTVLEQPQHLNPTATMGHSTRGDRGRSGGPLGQQCTEREEPNGRDARGTSREPFDHQSISQGEVCMCCSKTSGNWAPLTKWVALPCNWCCSVQVIEPLQARLSTIRSMRESLIEVGVNPLVSMAKQLQDAESQPVATVLQPGEPTEHQNTAQTQVWMCCPGKGAGIGIFTQTVLHHLATGTALFRTFSPCQPVCQPSTA
jgi:hypothetical protein